MIPCLGELPGKVMTELDTYSVQSHRADRNIIMYSGIICQHGEQITMLLDYNIS